MLDAADVRVDRRPLVGLARSRTPRSGRPARGSAGSTTSCRRTCPSCRGRAAPASPVSGSTVCIHSVAPPSGEVPLGVRSRPCTSGSVSGSCSSGTGTMRPSCGVDHRDRRAPEALARDQPVAQAIRLRGAARAGGLELLDDASDRVALGQPVQRAGVDHPALAGEGDAGASRGRGRRGIASCARIDRHAVLVELDDRDRAGHRRRRVDDDLDGQIERAREVEVALVVRGDGHDGAVTVVGQHVVGGPDRQSLAVDRVDRVALEEDARLRAVGALALDVGLAADALEVVLEAHPHLGGRAGGEFGGQIAVGRDDEERRAVQRVGTRREHRHGALATLDLEVDVGADRAADPVALHPDDLLRPEALELVQVVEQPVGVVGDLEVPLRELLLDDLGAAPLAVAVDDLLVREHRLVVGAPVDRALLAVREAALVEPLEEPLVPAVVLRVAGVQDARPVVRRAVLAEALLVLLDVGVGPLARVGTALDGRVLGGQAERVPPDRVQHVVAAVAPEARHDVDVARSSRRGPCAGRRTGTGTCRARTCGAACRSSPPARNGSASAHRACHFCWIA